MLKNPPRQIWQAIAEDIKEDIVNGVYKPHDHLKEIELAKKYAVSKTPVREALRHLGGIGFVEMIPNRMARVTTMNREDVQDLYHIQAVLEGLAARDAVPHLGKKDFEQLEKYVTLLEKHSVEKKSRSYEKANIQFHAVFWKASRNKRLIGMIHTNNEQLQRFRTITRRYPERFKDLAADHRKIIEAALQRDVQKIENLFRRHVEKQEKYIVDLLEKDNHF